MNIIIKDRRSESTKQKDSFSKEVLRGCYNEECRGTYDSKRRPKGRMRKDWESFPHDKDIK